MDPVFILSGPFQSLVGHMLDVYVHTIRSSPYNRIFINRQDENLFTYQNVLKQGEKYL